MPKSKDDGYKSGGGKGGKRRPTPPRPGNPDADPVKIHRDYVERRLAGGAPPTSEQYQRAYEEWRRLPGAVTAPPAGAVRPSETDPGRSGDEPDPNEDKPQ